MSTSHVARGASGVRLAWLAFVTVALAFAGDPLPDGPPFLLEDGAERPAASMDASGRSAFAWVKSAAPRVVRVQFFDPAGVPVAAPATADQGLFANALGGPDVAHVGSAGDAIVAWPVGPRQKARRFDASGQPNGDTWTAGEAELYTDATPGLGGAANGRFVLGRMNGYFYEYAGHVLGRAFDESGAPVTWDRLLCWRCGNYGYDGPDAGTASNGDYVVVWQDWNRRVRARLAAPDGSTRRDLIIDHDGFGERVVVTPAGTFIAAWSRMQSTGGDLVVAQRFDAAGNAIGAEIPVATHRPCSVGISGVEYTGLAQDGDGNFAVTYTDEPTLGSCGVYVRRFHADGTPDGSAVRVDTGGITYTDLETAMDANGNFAVAWKQGTGVQARRFCGALRVTDPETLTVCEGQPATFATTARGRDPFAFQWLRNGIPLSDGGRISGASGGFLTIDPVTPADAGDYACGVTDGCATPSATTTLAATLSVAPVPGAAENLMVTRAAPDVLHFGWTDGAFASDFVVREDSSPAGGFGEITGFAPGGATGLDAPLPDGNRFYLVRGRNGCGEGP